MNVLSGRVSRLLVVGLTLVVALTVVGVLSAFTQAARADVASPEGSTKTKSSNQVSPEEILTYTTVLRNDGEAPVGSITVSDAVSPSVVIKSPWNNQLFTEAGQFLVRGRAWTDDQTPLFPDKPVLWVLYPEPDERWYYIDWDPVTTAGTYYFLQEAIDPYFDHITKEMDGLKPTDEDVPVYFSKSLEDGDGPFYYRALARTPTGESLWSDPVSVTVGSTTGTAASYVQPLVSDVTLYQPVIKVNIRAVDETEDNWLPVTSVTLNDYGWWDWTYAWELPEEDDVQYVVQARAEDEAGLFDPDAVDTITVTIRNQKRLIYMPIIAKRWPPIPYAPVLLPVVDNDGRGNYTLSWTYHESILPSSYRLQEARDAAFTTIVREFTNLPTSPTSYAVTGGSGTLYYRVAGVNQYGLGEWSNVVSVTTGYFENFSSSATGWPQATYTDGGRAVFTVGYVDNTNYRAKIELDTGGLNNKKVGTVAAPWSNPFSAYEVKVDHYFKHAGTDQYLDPSEGSGGLIFGGNSNLSTFYVLEWNFNGHCAVTKYVGATAPVVDPLTTTRVEIKGWGPCSSVRSGYDQVNTARVVVTIEGGSRRAQAYINGVPIHTFTDAGLVNHTRVGFVTGSWLYTPVEGRFDNLSVVPR